MKCPPTCPYLGTEAYFSPFLKYFKNASKILDLGCYEGYFLDLLKKNGLEGVGLEIDPEAATQARNRGLEVINADMFDYLATTTDRYDGCLASHIIEHFLPQQVRRLFVLIARVLRPHGVLVVITPNIANLRRAVGDFWRDPDHVRPYPISAIRQLLPTSTWQVIDSGYLYNKNLGFGKRLLFAWRNLLVGHFWGGDDLFVIAQKIALNSSNFAKTPGHAH